MKSYIKAILLCAVFYSGALFAVTVKNEDILNQRLSIVILYNELQKKKNIKNIVEKQEKKPLETRLCKFNKVGTIFAHIYDDKDDTENTIADVFDNGNHVASWSGINFSDCICNPKKLDHVAIVGSAVRDGRFWSVATWYRLYYDRRSPLVMSDASFDNPINTVAFSPNGKKFFCVREKYNFFYDKESKEDYTWLRPGVKQAVFLNEKHIVSLYGNNSKASVFTIEENPKELPLEQGSGWKPQQVVLSHDKKTLAIASTYSGVMTDFPDNYLLTKVVFYDAQTLKIKRVLYVPGELFSGRSEQHEKISFSPDDTRIFMHTNTLNEGVYSWSFDINSNNEVLRIKHSKEIEKLYEFCGDYHFGGIDGKKALIFDIRNQNRSIDMKIDNPSHVALNPNVDSKTKAIIAVQGTTELFCYPKN